MSTHTTLRTVLAVAFALSVVACNDSPEVIPSDDGEIFRPTPGEVAEVPDSLSIPTELPPLEPAAPMLRPPIETEEPALPAVDPVVDPETSTPPEAEPAVPPATLPAVDDPATAPAPPAEPDFADLAFHPGATFEYEWRLDTLTEQRNGLLVLTLGGGEDVAVDALGGAVVTMYPVTMGGDIPPGFRAHEALGAHGNVLLGARQLEDGSLDTTVLFDPNDGGYLIEQGFSAMLPLVDTPLVTAGELNDGRNRYPGIAVWTAENAVEMYRSGIGFSALDVQGELVDDEGNAKPGHLRVVLVATSLLS
jgi:hypothetical protein